jgi:HK97 family phage major capsid protein
VSGTGAADLIDLMISADYKIDSQENGKGVWYCNRTIFAHLHKQALTKVGQGAGLNYENYQGKRVLMFLGCPIRLCDGILNSEARVV